MIEEYLPLVRFIADSIYRDLPSGIDLDSLIHSGVAGLLATAQRYDSRHGASFHAYARHRVPGEILAYFRSLDWVRHALQAWGQQATKPRIRLAETFNCEATVEEIATELNVSPEEYARINQKVGEAVFLRWEDLSLASEGAWKNAQEQFFATPFQDLLLFFIEQGEVEALSEAIEALPDQERLVMTLYYHEEMTIKEISRILDLPEEQVGQVQSQGVARLREALGSHQRPNGTGLGTRW